MHMWIVTSVMFGSLPPCRPTRLLCWDPPGKKTGVGCPALLQGIFLTQGSNQCLLYLLHWQAGSLPLSHLGSPVFLNFHTITIINDILHVVKLRHSTFPKIIKVVLVSFCSVRRPDHSPCYIASKIDSLS